MARVNRTMQVKVGDVIGLFGETESFELLDVWENEFGLLDDGRNIQLSDVFVCVTDNKDGTITKTYWDGVQVTETLDGDYRTWEDVA
jgi:hypothetical protein